MQKQTLLEEFIQSNTPPLQDATAATVKYQTSYSINNNNNPQGVTGTNF